MIFLFLILILFEISTCLVNNVADNSTIIISLENYNVFLPEGESFDSLHTIPPHSTSEIVLTNVPENANFVVMQVHSYLVNVTLSLDSTPFRENSIAGTNVGLVKMNRNTDLIFYLTYNSSFEEADIMVSVQAYSKNAPIPGGCNMEFQVEISPFLFTTFDEAITEVHFAPSAPPLSVLPQSLPHSNSECNIKPSPVRHIMYHQYFPERDFTKETYFNVLKSMMTKGRILENGVLASEKLLGNPMKRIFATYPGTGNAFAVIAYYGNYSTVYVPSFTYGCNNLIDDNTCLVLTTTFSKVLCASALFMGLFACFFGHFFFRIEMFLFTILAVGIVTYIIVSVSFSNSIALSSSVVIGAFCGVVKLVFWSLCGSPIISLALTTLTFGFFLASLIFYPILDFSNLLTVDINFWGIFIGIMFTCFMLMIFLAEKANIFSCAFLGSYIAIISVDYYIGSNLRYIIVNTIRRAVVDNFNLAFTSPPFQYKDILLSITWMILKYVGIKVQKRLMKNKPPYPPPENRVKNAFRRWKRPSKRSNERTPLLVSAEKANIFSCAFLGSYIAIISVDYYIGSNLRYIIVNTIRRAVLDNFNLAFTSPPFQC